MSWLCLGNASYLQGTLAFFEIEEQFSGPAGVRAQLSMCQDMSIPTQETAGVSWSPGSLQLPGHPGL